MAGVLDEHPTIAARWLLGAVVDVCRGAGSVAVRITEVEAYGGVGEDPGSHAYRGRTDRNGSMFETAGTLYAYWVYGRQSCLNVVTGSSGSAGAVLLRAGEVVSGVDIARSRRHTSKSDRDLARGPARLAVALDVSRADDGLDLLDPSSQVRLRLPSVPADHVVQTARTGVSGPGAVTPWRFHLPGERTVSPYRPATPRQRTA